MRHDHRGLREGRIGRGGGRGPMGPREHEAPSTTGLAAWFAGRLPDGWFEGAPEVSVDRDEIVVVGRVPAPTAAGATGEPAPQAADQTDTPSAAGTPSAAADQAGSASPSGAAAAGAEAAAGRISRFREQTRDERMAIAREAEHRYGRKVAWGAQVGDTRQLFTTMSVPVMTRLRQPERQVLDTLVAAGVARSRSDALAWSVRLVGRNADDWLTELRTAMEAVDKVREQGPAS